MEVSVEVEGPDLVVVKGLGLNNVPRTMHRCAMLHDGADQVLGDGPVDLGMDDIVHVSPVRGDSHKRINKEMWVE